MITNEMREYLIDFFNWFPVDKRGEAVRSLVGFGDRAIKLYDHFRETDRQVMDDVHRIFKDKPEKIAFFESKSPGLRCFLWGSFSNFLFDEYPEED